MLKALLCRTLGVPRKAANRVRASEQADGALVERIKHTLSFSWLDDRIWLRVYRIGRNPAGSMDVEEIGPRLVLQPVRIIASGFQGAVLHSHEPSD